MDLQNFKDLVDNRVKKVFMVSKQEVEEEYLKYSANVKYDQNSYTLFSVVGLGMGQMILDGQTPAADRPLQGYQKTVTQAIFTHRYRLGQKASYFLGLGNTIGGKGQVIAKLDAELQKASTNLRNSINHVKNALAQSMLAQGFSTSFTFTPLANSVVDQISTSVDTTSLDGVAAWSAGHVTADGLTTYSNLVTVGATVNAPFSFASLLAARTAYSKIKGDRGLPVMGRGLNTIIVLKDSANAFLATTIKNTLNAGMYPSTNGTSSTAGISGSFVDRAPTNSFEIVELLNYNNVPTALTSEMYFLADSEYIGKEGFGLNHIETLPTTITPVFQDLAGNFDIVLSAINYATFAFGDTRFVKASNGTGI